MGVVISKGNKVSDQWNPDVKREIDSYLMTNAQEEEGTEPMKEAVKSIGNVHQLSTALIGGQSVDLMVILLAKHNGNSWSIVVTDGSSKFYYANRGKAMMESDKKRVCSLFSVSPSTTSKDHQTNVSPEESKKTLRFSIDYPKSENDGDEEMTWKMYAKCMQSTICKSNFRLEFREENGSYEATIRLIVDSHGEPTISQDKMLGINIPMTRVIRKPAIEFAIQDLLKNISQNQIQSQGHQIVSTGLTTPKSVADLQNMLEKKEEEIEKLSGQVKKLEEKGAKSESTTSDDETFDVPLEKVMDILQKWKANTQDKEELKKLDYIMKVIQDESLYDVDVIRMVNKEQDSEIKTWIESELLVSNPSKRRWSTVKAYSKAIYFAKMLKMETEEHVYTTPSLSIPTDILEVLNDIDNYDFDIFKLNEVTNGRPLFYLSLRLFEIHDLYSKFKIPIHKFREFLDRVEKGYIDNPYHNKIHAADVLHTLNYLVTHLSEEHAFDPLAILSFLVTAIMHDYMHPGVNNGFEIKTSSDRALLYNDQAVLESYHCTSFFRLIREEKCNFLEGLQENDLRMLRDSLIHMVLGTDMSQHFIILGHVRTTILTSFDGTKREDRFTLMRLLMKCADVSNPTKALPLCYQWAQRVTDEFFLQGDKEKELGLPISPFMDRTKPNLCKSQVGFIDYICKPLYECLASFDSSYQFIMTKISENREHFHQQIPVQEST